MVLIVIAFVSCLVLGINNVNCNLFSWQQNIGKSGATVTLTKSALKYEINHETPEKKIGGVRRLVTEQSKLGKTNGEGREGRFLFN